VFPDREHGIGYFNHVGATLSWREPQQCPNLRSVYPTLILDGLLLEHVSRIGQEVDLRGAARARTDDDRIMSSCAFGFLSSNGRQGCHIASTDQGLDYHRVSRWFTRDQSVST
jgi:hypothetical protein